MINRLLNLDLDAQTLRNHVALASKNFIQQGGEKRQNSPLSLAGMFVRQIKVCHRVDLKTLNEHNVYDTLLQLLKSKNGSDSLKSFKYMLSSQILGKQANNDQEAQAMVKDLTQRCCLIIANRNISVGVPRIHKEQNSGQSVFAHRDKLDKEINMTTYRISR